MIPAGIVDPTKVTRSALENAASIAGCVLTTESLVVDKPDPAADAAPGREQRRPPPGEQGEGCPIGSGRACDAVFELGAKPQSSNRILIPF